MCTTRLEYILKDSNRLPVFCISLDQIKYDYHKSYYLKENLNI